MKKLLLLFFIIHFVNAQKNVLPTIYLDTNFSEIDSIYFFTKSKTLIYSEERVIKDSLIIKYLVYNFNFKKFNTKELNQVYTILKKDYGITEFNKNIILEYQDSLLGFTEYKESNKHTKPLDDYHKITRDNYIASVKSNDIKKGKCHQFIIKNNITPIYLHSVNQGFNYALKYYKHKKISKIIKKIFFKNVSNGLVILKPNGQYFYYRYLPEHKVEKMLNEDWETYIKAYDSIDKNPVIFYKNFIEKLKNEEKKLMVAKGRKLMRQQIENSGRTNRIIVRPPYCFVSATYKN